MFIGNVTLYTVLSAGCKEYERRLCALLDFALTVIASVSFSCHSASRSKSVGATEIPSVPPQNRGPSYIRALLYIRVPFLLYFCAFRVPFNTRVASEEESAVLRFCVYERCLRMFMRRCLRMCKHEQRHLFVSSLAVRLLNGRGHE